MDAVQVLKPNTLGYYLHKAFDLDFNAETGTYLAGSGSARSIVLGQVLGALYTPGTITTAAAAGNTGNGTLTLANPANTSAVKPGTYFVTCTEPATNGGTFAIEDPDGIEVGIARVGVAFDGVLKFTINDGATDYVAGDRHLITVPDGSVKYVPLNFSGTDGSQNAAAVALAPVTVPDGSDEVGPVLVRGPAIGLAAALVWPSGATAAQKAAATRQLAALGIIHR